ncbi:hypothetical protein ABPG72_018472 [Tetrahymena utriculariae]
MTLTAENLINTIHQIINDLKQDIFQRFNYNLDENLTYLDLTRNLILLENVFSEESIKRSQELQNRLSQQYYHHHHHHSQSSIINRSYNQSIQNPINIQNQQDEFQTNQSYSNHTAVYYPKVQELDSSKDSIPQFHKQLLREYKNSMEQLKKQNKIIRTLVKENSYQNPKLRSIDYQDQDYLRRDNYINTFETNLNNQSSTDEHIRHPSKSYNALNRSQDHVYKSRGQKVRSSAKKQYLKAEKELQDLQDIREKEIQKIKQIERAIRKREEIAAPKNITSSEMEQIEYVKSQKKLKDKQYISKINEQISKLDKEIRQITSYIQDCILKEQ